ncbi:MAG TPA: glycosyltransferase family 2 protein [Bacteroidota bacterium]|nr:glycosyltransferase family 2 protein [Bacteroidota bacterium]
MIDVSVIIVNHNRKDLLEHCLRSVVEANVQKEVIVVDNASTDGSRELVERLFPDVVLIKNSTNERFAKPNNDAMRIARGRYFFLLNNDAILQPGSLESLLAFMENHPDVGMVGPQLLNPDGSIQPSCLGFMSFWTHLFDMLALDRLFPNSPFFAAMPMTYFDHSTEREVDHIMAAALLVRAEAVAQVGLMDERLTIYYNDTDWSFRFKAAGWKRVFYPAAKVIHHGGQTTARIKRDKGVLEEQYDNTILYYRKRYGLTGVFYYRVFLFFGFVARLLYWAVRSVMNKSEDNRWMFEFSLRSVRVAISPPKISLSSHSDVSSSRA